MRLAFATSSFVYAGLPRPGLPIILGDDMYPLQPAQDFIVHKLLGQGKSLSPLTWEDYGRRLWDYFAFLNANGIAWDDPATETGKGPVARYKAWSLTEAGVSAKTLNGRLRLVAKFYEWAVKQGLIATVPYGYEERRVGARDHFLKHAEARDATAERADIFVREWAAMPEFLAKEQVQACLRSVAMRKDSRRLLFNLMWRVGLRSCEARTFPLSYVFDPTKRKDCRPGRMIRIRLDPADMSIKFGKPREVDVPFSLMGAMYTYTLYERNRQASASTQEHSALVLNEYGRPYSKDAVGDLFRALSAQVGFRATALMLRHSYAVHTLARLRKEPSFEGEPLLYVRDRLGHSDVQTTAIYLSQINQLASQLVLAIEDEFDRMFEMPVAQ